MTHVAVPVVTLDRLVRTEGVSPTVVKVDVEGYEFEVLRGAADLLQTGTAWVVEIHPPQLRLHGRTDTQVTDLFTAAGYRVDVIDRNPNTLYTILATRAYPNEPCTSST